MTTVAIVQVVTSTFGQVCDQRSEVYVHGYSYEQLEQWILLTRYAIDTVKVSRRRGCIFMHSCIELIPLGEILLVV